MPFTSLKQQRFMFANHPKIARKMADKMKKKGMKFATKKHPRVNRRRKKK
jgi:hypothetical protein